MERDNNQWLSDLSQEGPRQREALADLRGMLVRGLSAALRASPATDVREFSGLVEDFVQEALLAVMSKLDTFQGLSRFTTWAHKVALRIALSELRRRRWRDVSLDAAEARYSMPSAPPPTAAVEDRMMLEWLEARMREELTPLQQRAMRATLRGMPMDAVAERLGMQRNALYKLLHDARLKLKRCMYQERNDALNASMKGGAL